MPGLACLPGEGTGASGRGGKGDESRWAGPQHSAFLTGALVTPRDRAAGSHQSSKHPRLPLGLAWQPGLRPPCCPRLPWRHLTGPPGPEMLGLISVSLGDQVVTAKPAGLGVCNSRGEAGAGPVGWDAAEHPVDSTVAPCWAPGAQCPGRADPAAERAAWCGEGTRGKRGALESGPRTQQRTHRTAERAPSLGPRAQHPEGREPGGGRGGGPL